MEALAHAPKKELLSIKGISEAKVEKIQKEGGSQLRPAHVTRDWTELCFKIRLNFLQGSWNLHVQLGSLCRWALPLPQQ